MHIATFAEYTAWLHKSRAPRVPSAAQPSLFSLPKTPHLSTGPEGPGTRGGQGHVRRIERGPRAGQMAFMYGDDPGQSSTFHQHMAGQAPEPATQSAPAPAQPHHDAEQQRRLMSSDPEDQYQARKHIAAHEDDDEIRSAALAAARAGEGHFERNPGDARGYHVRAHAQHTQRQYEAANQRNPKMASWHEAQARAHLTALNALPQQTSTPAEPAAPPQDTEDTEESLRAEHAPLKARYREIQDHAGEGPHAERRSLTDRMGDLEARAADLRDKKYRQGRYAPTAPAQPEQPEPPEQPSLSEHLQSQQDKPGVEAGWDHGGTEKLHTDQEQWMADRKKAAAAGPGPTKTPEQRTASRMTRNRSIAKRFLDKHAQEKAAVEAARAQQGGEREVSLVGRAKTADAERPDPGLHEHLRDQEEIGRRPAITDPEPEEGKDGWGRDLAPARSFPGPKAQETMRQAQIEENVRRAHAGVPIDVFSNGMREKDLYDMDDEATDALLKDRKTPADVLAALHGNGRTMAARVVRHPNAHAATLHATVTDDHMEDKTQETALKHKNVSQETLDYASAHGAGRGHLIRGTVGSPNAQDKHLQAAINNGAGGNELGAITEHPNASEATLHSAASAFYRHMGKKGVKYSSSDIERNVGAHPNASDAQIRDAARSRAGYVRAGVASRKGPLPPDVHQALRGDSDPQVMHPMIDRADIQTHHLTDLVRRHPDRAVASHAEDRLDGLRAKEEADYQARRGASRTAKSFSAYLGDLLTKAGRARMSGMSPLFGDAPAPPSLFGNHDPGEPTDPGSRGGHGQVRTITRGPRKGQTAFMYGDKPGPQHSLFENPLPIPPRTQAPTPAAPPVSQAPPQRSFAEHFAEQWNKTAPPASATGGAPDNTQVDAAHVAHLVNKVARMPASGKRSHAAQHSYVPHGQTHPEPLTEEPGIPFISGASRLQAAHHLNAQADAEDAAAEASRPRPTPALTGSTKQIKWATSIRATALQELASLGANLRSRADTPETRAALAQYQAAYAFMRDQSSATFWIERVRGAAEDGPRMARLFSTMGEERERHALSRAVSAGLGEDNY